MDGGGRRRMALPRAGVGRPRGQRRDSVVGPDLDRPPQRLGPREPDRPLHRNGRARPADEGAHRGRRHELDRWSGGALPHSPPAHSKPTPPTERGPTPLGGGGGPPPPRPPPRP